MLLILTLIHFYRNTKPINFQNVTNPLPNHFSFFNLLIYVFNCISMKALCPHYNKRVYLLCQSLRTINYSLKEPVIQDQLNLIENAVYRKSCLPLFLRFTVLQKVKLISIKNLQHWMRNFAWNNTYYGLYGLLKGRKQSATLKEPI